VLDSHDTMVSGESHESTAKFKNELAKTEKANTKMENENVNQIERDYYNAQWAGYDNNGNDRNGHMHFHPVGNFYRSDGARGFYCAAPLNAQEECSDPIPFNERAGIQLGSNPDTGGEFMHQGMLHEIMGFYLETHNDYWMYSYVKNDPDNLRFVYKWKHVGDNAYQLTAASNYTVLDMVAHFDKVKGF
jgi:hypothetical protein